MRPYDDDGRRQGQSVGARSRAPRLVRAACHPGAAPTANRTAHRPGPPTQPGRTPN
eukprot:CAMPEP_0185551842 /NCGR_PEP_ID=MMETSP1381-20130426/29781_1 /TAXON_ID=298111 /ORGANISM="Pavlova sp., Strain CCMP459" /LENGTH=55 /DNA_ID=CAMNT_0028164747 /DNA_START=102 /DNA_END=266 /DNA_ORIENTATION=+